VIKPACSFSFLLSINMFNGKTFFNFRMPLVLRMRNVSDKFIDEIKTHILYSVTFFDNRAVYDKMRKKLYRVAGHKRQYGACALHAGYPRLQMRTLRLCNTYSSVKMVLRTRLNITLDVHCLSCCIQKTMKF
jgi:hypothetical protein